MYFFIILVFFSTLLTFFYLYLGIIFMTFDIFSATCGDDFIAGEESKRIWIWLPRDVDCSWNIKSQSADEIIWVKLFQKIYVEVTFDSSVCLLHAISLLPLSFFSSAFLVSLKTDKITKSNKIYSKFVVLVSTFFRSSGKYKQKRSLWKQSRLKPKIGFSFFYWNCAAPEEGSFCWTCQNGWFYSA